ncbi:hypothetical protein GCM10009530_26200 [Microbispora corallina]|uniref:Gram-positive cocci surface proteins LPxTG domain-containing protein n=1 Tax=Microbispora corallina TaxID=83302 RepID=A0ABQ4G4U0_9ACTN|nr:hypothetical protein [Microbispora corallina]GIH42102.1 hypothetical protein Mco01_51020 [Microbispora corallina]
MASRSTIPILLAATVAGGLAFGCTGVAAAQAALSPPHAVDGWRTGVYPPSPAAQADVFVEPRDTHTNTWSQSVPNSYAWNNTKNNDGQVLPVVAPGAVGGAAPEEAGHEAAPKAEEKPATETSTETSTENKSEPEEESEEAGEPAESQDVAQQPGGAGQLPFTGAPVKVAVVGAGLLSVALACILLSVRRRRSGAE